MGEKAHYKRLSPVIILTLVKETHILSWEIKLAANVITNQPIMKQSGTLVSIRLGLISPGMLQSHGCNLSQGTLLPLSLWSCQVKALPHSLSCLQLCFVFWNRVLYLAGYLWPEAPSQKQSQRIIASLKEKGSRWQVAQLPSTFDFLTPRKQPQYPEMEGTVGVFRDPNCLWATGLGPAMLCCAI